MNKNIFLKNNFTIVENVIDENVVNLVTQYALFDEIQNFNADQSQVIGSHMKYADPLTESILLHILPIVEENSGIELYPTYSFYRVYRSGQELKKHIDRESCEISCTLSFKYSYSSSEYQWPIFMNGEKIILDPGDLAIYKGMEVEHWREPMSPPSLDDWHVQAFFHYVDKNGPYSNFAYDKRKNIGMKKYGTNNKKTYISSTVR